MLEGAIPLDPTVIIPIDQLDILVGSVMYQDVFHCLIWTCIFSVKASFLALFRLMVRNVSKELSIYYWVVVVYVLVVWMFMVSEVFILCPYFGLDQGKSPLAESKSDIGQAHPENSKMLPQRQLSEDCRSDDPDRSP